MPVPGAWAVAILSVLALASCGDGRIDSAKALAADSMKDPAAAQFRNVRRSTTDAEDVCGEVNGKNSYGAYTGFKRFVVAGGNAFMEGDGDAEITALFEVLWSAGC